MHLPFPSCEPQPTLKPDVRDAENTYPCRRVWVSPRSTDIQQMDTSCRSSSTSTTWPGEEACLLPLPRGGPCQAEEVSCNVILTPGLEVRRWDTSSRRFRLWTLAQRARGRRGSVVQVLRETDKPASQRLLEHKYCTYPSALFFLSCFSSPRLPSHFAKHFSLPSSYLPLTLLTILPCILCTSSPRGWPSPSLLRMQSRIKGKHARKR